QLTGREGSLCQAGRGPDANDTRRVRKIHGAGYPEVGEGREILRGQGRLGHTRGTVLRETWKPVAERFRFTVNGAQSELEASPDTPLLYALRNDLSLKGTRFGCGSGQCGACFVLIDGYPAPACDTPLWSVAGKRIVTVEGLGREGSLHPLQQAFLAEQAAQCGYCTSGVLISAGGVLAKTPSPTESEVRAALDRNLCRCGSHNRMVRAVLRAASPT